MDHDTVPPFVPVTVAARACAAPVCTVNAAGEMETAIAICTETSTVAVAVFLGSACADATTRKVPAVFGAVTRPPPAWRTEQSAALSNEPVTVAVNWADWPRCRAALGGATPMVMTGGVTSDVPPTAEGPQAANRSAARSAPTRTPIPFPPGL